MLGEIDTVASFVEVEPKPEEDAEELFMKRSISLSWIELSKVKGSVTSQVGFIRSLTEWNMFW